MLDYAYGVPVIARAQDQLIAGRWDPFVGIPHRRESRSREVPAAVPLDTRSNRCGGRR